MNHKHAALINQFNAEFIRTTGKKGHNHITYNSGWFTLPNGNKERAKSVQLRIDVMKLEPTAVGRFEMVNGVSAWIAADMHVVKSHVGGHDVIEAKDTPYGCSVSDEAYWAN